MTLVTLDLTQIQPGQTNLSAPVRNALNAIVAAVNGALDDSNFATTAALRLSKLNGYPNDNTKFARGDGTWAVPAGGGGAAGTQLDSKALTADVTVTATTGAGANAIATGNAVSYDGSDVLVEFYAPSVVKVSNANQVTFVLYDGSTQLGNLGVIPVGSGEAFYGRARLTPSAATHTYTVKAFLDVAGSATVKAGNGAAGNLVNAYLRVVRA